MGLLPRAHAASPLSRQCPFFSLERQTVSKVSWIDDHQGGSVEVRGLICMTSQVARDVAAIVGKRRLYAGTKRAVVPR